MTPTTSTNGSPPTSTTVGGLPLRDYQADAITAIDAAWARGCRRAVLVAPTGAGKTIMFAHLAGREVAAGHRVLVLTHRVDLVDQTVDRIRQVYPGVDVGVAQAERRDSLDAPVVVASVPTLVRWARPALDALAPHLVISDECHHAGPGTGWAALMDRLDAVRPGVRHLGVTATYSRADRKSSRLDDVWTDGVVHEIRLAHLIRLGHLIQPHARTVTVDDLDLDTVGMSRGDYSDADLARALEAAGAPKVAAQAYASVGACETRQRMRPAIAFSPTVTVAKALTAELQAVGVRAETITADTDRHARAVAYQAVRDGRLDVLSSVGVLTEGFDLPEAEVLIGLRPTRSWTLFTQMTGRVLRPAPWAGKTGALVLDVTGGASAHRLDCRPLTLEDVPDLNSDVHFDDLEQRVARRLAENKRGSLHALVTGQAEMHPMLADSPLSWTTTRAGAHVILGRDTLWVLWPGAEPGMWRVARGNPRQAGSAVFLPGPGQGCDLPTAMAWAEADARAVDPSITARAAPWRKKRASEKQVIVLRSMGVPEDALGEVRAGEASDVISWAAASHTVDRRWREAKARWEA